jgi:hypothetical protein
MSVSRGTNRDPASYAITLEFAQLPWQLQLQYLTESFLRVLNRIGKK